MGKGERAHVWGRDHWQSGKTHPLRAAPGGQATRAAALARSSPRNRRSKAIWGACGGAGAHLVLVAVHQRVGAREQRVGLGELGGRLLRAAGRAAGPVRHRHRRTRRLGRGEVARAMQLMPRAEGLGALSGELPTCTCAGWRASEQAAGRGTGLPVVKHSHRVL